MVSVRGRTRKSSAPVLKTGITLNPSKVLQSNLILSRYRVWSAVTMYGRRANMALQCDRIILETGDGVSWHQELNGFPPPSEPPAFSSAREVVWEGTRLYSAFFFCSASSPPLNRRRCLVLPV